MGLSYPIRSTGTRRGRPTTAPERIASAIADNVPGMSTSRPEQATAAACVALGAFQTALALGAPWGRAAYGGAHHGTLPHHLRAISGVAALAYGTGAVLVMRGSGSARARSRAYTVLSMLMGVGTIANGASRSPVERAIWTPFTAAMTVAAWRARTAHA